MQYRAALTYTEPLVAGAVRAYWNRTIGPAFLFAVALLIAFLVWLLVNGDRSWLVGLTAAVALLGVVMPVAVYVVHYRNSMGKFREMSDPVAELLADDETFTLSSDRGTTCLRWNTVAEVWRFESLWLLLFSKAQFITLPLKDVPAPMQAFMLDRIKSAGGKIAP